MVNKKRASASKPKLKQPEPIKHRPTAAEKEARVSQVMTLLLGGARRIEVVQFAAKTWGIETRQSDKLIADATELIKAAASKSRDEEIIEHVGRMDLIFRQAHSAGDYSNAIKAAQDKAKLRGLYPDARVKVLTWEDEIIQLLRDGKLTVEDVVAEFGEQQGYQFAFAAGIRPVAARPAEGAAGNPEQERPA